MPITLQKKRSSKKGNKTQNTSCNEEHNESFLSKFFSRIPATFIFIFLIFLWSTSTTFISGSIVHVCVTSRKLNNNHLYCLSAGAQPSNLDTTNLTNNFPLIDNKAEVPPVLQSPLSPLVSISPKKQEKDEKNIFDHQISSTIIEIPKANEDVKSKNLTNKIISLHAKEEDDVEGANKEVEDQMKVLRSYKIRRYIDYSNSDACEKRGIFVYDLPSKFNKDLIDQCSDKAFSLDFCKFISNGALGEAVPQLGNGWYNTHEYALEPIFHARVLKHPCRVQNPDEAKVFYVPFYGGLDILKSHFKENTSNDIKDKLTQELIKWLEQQRFWKRNFGLDHVFVLGKVSWDFRRGKNATWGTRFLDLDETQNSIKLLIERNPWHGNDVAIPYPTSFHPRSDNDIVSWQTKIMKMSRKNLASFVGTQKPNASKTIRSTVIDQCTSASTKCRFLNCTEGQCPQLGPVMNLLMDSEFCLHPSGDSITRKSFFDSLLVGCIPVVFDPFSAQYQYPWHLPVDRSNYAVFIDQKGVLQGKVNVIDRLEAVNAAEREEIRRYIVYEVMPGLIYADPQGKLVRFEDAFSVAMNSVLHKMSKLP